MPVDESDIHADVAQLVEQLIRNQQVVSSILIVGSKDKQGFTVFAVNPFFCCKFKKTVCTEIQGINCILKFEPKLLVAYRLRAIFSGTR